MHTKEIHCVMGLLIKQVKSLKLPFLDEMSTQQRDPFKVLVSCILSLRTQDKTTSGASQRLYRLASTPDGIASLKVNAIQKAIYPVGFYRVKAQRIKELSKTLIEDYEGKVPDTIAELLKLRGVGRKTANLVVTLGWNKPGICVDTHVHRITNRLGYIKTKTPEQTEFALREKLPRRYWKEINGLLVAFGQNICKPISPLCTQCSIFHSCERVGVSRYR